MQLHFLRVRVWNNFNEKVLQHFGLLYAKNSLKKPSKVEIELKLMQFSQQHFSQSGMNYTFEFIA